MKKCVTCNQEKELDEFYASKRSEDKLQGRCKDCCIAYGKAYRQTEQAKQKAKDLRTTTAYKQRKKIQSQTPQAKYKTYQKGAKQRDYPFDLSFTEFLTFWQVPCSYCGDSIETIGLDCLDPLQGYKLENIKPACWLCNRIKSRLSIEELNQHLIKMLKHQQVIEV